MTPDQTHDLIRYAIFAVILLGTLVAVVWTPRPARRSHTDRRLSPVEYATLEIVRAGLQRHGFDALKPEHVQNANRAARMIVHQDEKDDLQ